MLRISTSYLSSQRNWYIFYSNYSKYVSNTKYVDKPKNNKTKKGHK